jgi:hypothetical protein
MEAEGLEVARHVLEDIADQFRLLRTVDFLHAQLGRVIDDSRANGVAHRPSNDAGHVGPILLEQDRSLHGIDAVGNRDVSREAETVLVLKVDLLVRLGLLARISVHV